MKARRALPAVLTVLALTVVVLPVAGSEPDGRQLAPLTSVVEPAPSLARPPSPSSMGLTYSVAPRVAPGGGPELLPPTTESIRKHLESADSAAALREAERFLETKQYGRARAAASLVVGLLNREQGNWNAASEAFTRTRAGKGPLAPLGLWYEAEADFRRGKPWAAIRECKTYRERYPEGDHANECLALLAKAYVRLGRLTTAEETAEEYDKEEKRAKIGEQIALQSAKRLMAKQPRAAAARLKELAIEFEAPLTGRVAAELLSSLHAQGVDDAVVPHDTASLELLAESLRDGGKREAASEVYRVLYDRAESDPRLQRRLDAAAMTIGWRTHDWDLLAREYAKGYAKRANADDAWGMYVAEARAARWSSAVEQAKFGLEKHGTSWKWKRNLESVGRTYLLAKAYPDARDLFDRIAKLGGWRGRRARFSAAFASFMNGDHEDAHTRFSAIIEGGRSHVIESTYWRARADEALGRTEDAERAFAGILEDAPRSWYALVVRQRTNERPTMRPQLRDGRWSSLPAPTPPERAEVTFRPTHIPVAAFVGSSRSQPTSTYSLLTWPLERAEAPPPPIPSAPPVAFYNPLAHPVSYSPSAFFERADARETLLELERDGREAWPEIAAVRDLASVGLYDLSGPIASSFYEEWKKARYNTRNRLHRSARKAHVDREDWRELFYLVRDHHHTMRFTHGMWDDVKTPEDQRMLLRLGWPLAHDRIVWTSSRAHDVDPFLILGLMRIESRYDATAVSPVGARGAMQVMPRTGHLLAEMASDEDFTAIDLEDPAIAADYGIRYLGLLLDRWGGVLPPAVASYNAGPMSVTAWSLGTGPDMPMDVWVEHIPYKETRNYVKKVSAAYATYVDLYGPRDAEVVLSEKLQGNRRDVVDF